MFLEQLGAVEIEYVPIWSFQVIHHFTHTHTSPVINYHKLYYYDKIKTSQRDFRTSCIFEQPLIYKDL